VTGSSASPDGSEGAAMDTDTSQDDGAADGIFDHSPVLIDQFF
jgi:hypothetical protein